MPPATIEGREAFEILLGLLRESHELSVYESIERLVHAGEAVGLDMKALICMLDRGMTLDELLRLLQSKLERLDAAA